MKWEANFTLSSIMGWVLSSRDNFISNKHSLRKRYNPSQYIKNIFLIINQTSTRLVRIRNNKSSQNQFHNLLRTQWMLILILLWELSMWWKGSLVIGIKDSWKIMMRRLVKLRRRKRWRRWSGPWWQAHFLRIINYSLLIINKVKLIKYKVSTVKFPIIIHSYELTILILSSTKLPILIPSTKLSILSNKIIINLFKTQNNIFKGRMQTNPSKTKKPLYDHLDFHMFPNNLNLDLSHHKNSHVTMIESYLNVLQSWVLINIINNIKKIRNRDN